MIKSKKGDIPTVVFIIMTIAVCLGVLFLFLTSSFKTGKVLSDFSYIDKINLKEDSIVFYINHGIENSFVESYENFLSNGDYSLKIRQGYPVFENLEIDLNKNLVNNFKGNFKKNFKKVSFEEDYMKKINKIVSEERFIASIEKDILSLEIKDLELNENSDSINITYKPEIRIEYNLTKEGLVDFEDIYELKEICVDRVNLEKQEKCYQEYKNELDNFNIETRIVKVSENKQELVLEFESEKEFLIGDEFRRIEFSFIPG